MYYEYRWIEPKEHIITVRDRVTGIGRTNICWNQRMIDVTLENQKETEDVFITKYRRSRLVDTLILDFDSEDDPKLAFKETNKLRNYLKTQGINSVIVESGSKGNHIYIQIAPFLFADTELRTVSDWNSFFNAFVCFLIHNTFATYETLDKRNFNASLGGNIRLIGSKHPKTGKVCRIIKGSFKDMKDEPPTSHQDEALKKAYLKMEIDVQKREMEKQRQLKKTTVVGGNDPIAVNDLREVFREITGDIKLYPKGYGYCSCPVHGIDSHPSLMVTKEWFSCSACDFKGNIWTLKKMGLVKFGNNGEYRL